MDIIVRRAAFSLLELYAQNWSSNFGNIRGRGFLTSAFLIHRLRICLEPTFKYIQKFCANNILITAAEAAAASNSSQCHDLLCRFDQQWLLLFRVAKFMRKFVEKNDSCKNGRWGPWKIIRFPIFSLDLFLYKRKISESYFKKYKKNCPSSVDNFRYITTFHRLHTVRLWTPVRCLVL